MAWHHHPCQLAAPSDPSVAFAAAGLASVGWNGRAILTPSLSCYLFLSVYLPGRRRGSAAAAMPYRHPAKVLSLCAVLGHLPAPSAAFLLPAARPLRRMAARAPMATASAAIAAGDVVKVDWRVVQADTKQPLPPTQQVPAKPSPASQAGQQREQPRKRQPTTRQLPRRQQRPRQKH